MARRIRLGGTLACAAFIPLLAACGTASLQTGTQTIVTLATSTAPWPSFLTQSEIDALYAAAGTAEQALLAERHAQSAVIAGHRAQSAPGPVITPEETARLAAAIDRRQDYCNNPRVELGCASE